MLHGALALWLVASLAGCSSNSKPGDSTKPPPAGPCDGLATHVEALYRAQGQEDPEKAPAQPGDSTAASADVDMMLIDCRADPERVLACARAATSVGQLEHECLIPLDDQGRVEGRAFTGAQ
jgi:hypothetical protein